MTVCTNCGAHLLGNQTVCPECGIKLQELGNKCEACSTINPLGSRYCLKCGAPLTIEKLPVCPICGASNLKDAIFCKQCGSSLVVEEENNEQEYIDNLKSILPKLMGIKKKLADPFMGASAEQKQKMTYVCAGCGKVNFIEDDKCSRCGRSRRRSSVLTVEKLITPVAQDDESIVLSLEPEQDEVVANLVEPIELAPIEEAPAVEPKTAEPQAQPKAQPLVQPEMQPDFMKLYEQMLENSGMAGSQLMPIIQPIAFVPYISQDQPLWQYEVIENEKED